MSRRRRARGGRHAHPEEYPEREGDKPGAGAALRYALPWLAGTAAVVVALAVATGGRDERRPAPAPGLERAACRIDLRATPTADTERIALRYRVTLPPAELRRIADLAGRLGARVRVQADPRLEATAVAATVGRRRLRCARVDQPAVRVLLRFVLAPGG